MPGSVCAAVVVIVHPPRSVDGSCHDVSRIRLRHQRPAANPVPQRRSHLGLEQFQATALVAGRQTICVCTEVHHLVAELFVIAAHLVDDLLGAADQLFGRGSRLPETHRGARYRRAAVPSPR
ncbi:hypothetical protein MMAD_24370 [Mycolicibacterium madagascariense]|uniref:Uncharacterized protein n=1 Tax=Mycolicibacterium madagascariense TaxID=212765 RepID=A0A7I7XG21_9MYCO|nr:hypothetical protein MMAD_24370 [Mycolicibacterium madagascariense]